MVIILTLAALFAIAIDMPYDKLAEPDIPHCEEIRTIDGKNSCTQWGKDFTKDSYGRTRDWKTGEWQR